jgi:hypothetical protein
MFAQVEFNSSVKNGTITVPDDLISAIPGDVYVIVRPIYEQKKAKKQHIWLSGNSKIDNPIHIGENFRKVPRDELYEG